jgi:uncharacterized metal-binding protein
MRVTPNVKMGSPSIRSKAKNADPILRLPGCCLKNIKRGFSDCN